ncbi:MAG: hypothetical protein EOP05_20120, partial [Proteobacteria bacterium]
MSTLQDLRSSNHAAPQTGGVRFAPSPTGRFHVGNLRTAWISWKFAKALNIPWVVRYEDIDRPRVLAGAQEFQASDMREFGMKADVTLIQSEFYPRHLELFERARTEGAVYACDCSRKDVLNALAGMASAPNDGRVPAYSGHCRHRGLAREGGPTINPGIMSLAWRMKMPREDGQDDVIIARTSVGGEHFVPAYHWACAIDDFDGAYDLLVRSSDLAHALVIQRGIQEWLMKSHGLTRDFPRVFHTALITQNDGHRLEKRTAGVTLEELKLNGIDPAKLISVFEKSFDSGLLSAAFDGLRTLEEAPASMTLATLG